MLIFFNAALHYLGHLKQTPGTQTMHSNQVQKIVSHRMMTHSILVVVVVGYLLLLLRLVPTHSRHHFHQSLVVLKTKL